MRKRIFDTSILIGIWQLRRGDTPAQVKTANVKKWAEELISLYESDAIVTPVYLEMVAGVSSKRELELTRTFLQAFKCVDDGKILAEDWQAAIHLASRVPRDGKPRNMGDCLIRAIADRLGYDIITRDLSFPISAPKKKRKR